MSRSMHSLIGAALVGALSAGVAGQESTKEVTPQAGWLEELLDGDLATALRTYDRAMRSGSASPGSRSLAAQRRLEVARLQGDRPALERCLQLAPEASRTAYQSRKRTPDAALDLRIALAADDAERLVEARRQFVREFQDNATALRTDFALRSDWFPPYLGAPTAGTVAVESARPTAPRRLRLPLPPPANARGLLRLRAAQIADLRLSDRDERIEEAGRLESDLVARLLGDASMSAFVVVAPALDHQSRLDDASSIAPAERRLTQLLADPRLLPRELGVLRAIADKLRRLQQAGQPAEAHRLLRSLPYGLD